MGDQLILLLTGVGLIALGIYFIVGKNGLNKPGNALTVEATIVDFQTETDTSSTEGRGMTTTTSTFPVYAYQVNGRTYRTRGPVGITIFSKDRYQVGTTETISVCADNPGRIYTRGGANGSAAMGAILIAVGLFTFVFLILL